MTRWLQPRVSVVGSRVYRTRGSSRFRRANSERRRCGKVRDEPIVARCSRPGWRSQDLWEDGDRRFYKIWRESTDGMRHPYLAVLPATDPPTRGCLRRLEHEYELKEHVDAGWALRPLELVRGRGATALVLAYQDGQPLERMIARPIEVGAFLRI